MLQEVDVGIVVALGLEASPIRERLRESVRIRGSIREVATGSFGGTTVALIAAGVGRDAATSGTRLLIDGHRPRTIVAAGLCGGLDPSLGPGALVLADRVRLAAEGLAVGTAPFDQAALARLTLPHAGGTIVTSDVVVATPEAKQRLRQATAAVAVDMESFWVVQEASRAGLTARVIRTVCDTATETIAADVATLAASGHPARLAGAAMRLLWKRPSAIGELAELREQAHRAADTLADRLAELLTT